MLAPFSPKASHDDKIKHLFAVWDVDGDGIVSAQDMELILRQAAGASLMELEINTLIEKVLDAAGGDEGGLTLREFKLALQGAPIGLLVEIPVE